MRCQRVLGAISVLSWLMCTPVAAQSPAAPPTEASQPSTATGTARQRLARIIRCPSLSSPLFDMILDYQDELGLSAAQVEGLERVCLDFMRDAIRRQAELATASLDMVALLRPNATDPAKPVDMPKAEATIREIERVEAELDIAKLRSMEAAKAQLTADQRAKLASVMAGGDPRGLEVVRAPAPGGSGSQPGAPGGRPGGSHPAAPGGHPGGSTQHPGPPGGYHGGPHPGGHPYRPFVGVRPPYWWWYPYGFSGYAPPVIVEPAPGYEMPPPDAYWYYCPSSGAYYPYVETCDQPWLIVPSWAQ